MTLARTSILAFLSAAAALLLAAGCAVGPEFK